MSACHFLILLLQDQPGARGSFSEFVFVALYRIGYPYIHRYQ